MSELSENQIIQLEEKLRLAMLDSDVAVLDELLDENLVFTTHFGQLVNKAVDLSAHASGMVRINEITLSDMQTRVHGDVAIVAVQVYIDGSFAGNTSKLTLRFTRVWKNTDGRWKIIAAHSSEVAGV